MASDERLAELLDRAEVDRLQRSYADLVNRRAWSELGDLLRPDAVVELDLVDRPPIRLVGPEGFAATIAPAVERFTHFTFVILGSHVEPWPDGNRDEARARIWMCEVRTDEEGIRSEAHGLYRDRYVRVDGRWWIAGRRYRSIARYPDGKVFGPGDVSLAAPIDQAGS